jgi:hypothetical protein
MATWYAERSAERKELTYAASAARTVDGDSGTIEVQDAAHELRVQLEVTGTPGGTSPTLNVVVEDTLDGTNWNTIGTFAQKIAAGREVINVTTPFDRRTRARWDLGGTSPSFTFSVVGIAKQ